MTRLSSLTLLCALALFGASGLVSASAAASQPTWGTAVELPGSAALGTDLGVGSVSCASPGNCAAGDDYFDSSHHAQAFVVDQTNGTWGNPIQVPGTGSLNTGNSAYVSSISCPTAGNCSAGGSYRVDSTKRQPFVVDEKNGVWSTAIQVPGMASMNTGTSRYGDQSGAGSISCPTAGNCAAAGTYIDASGSIQPFIAEETNGTWGTAVAIPGMASLNTGASSSVGGISCATPGNCTVGGSYFDGSKNHAYVATETNGVWGTAIEVPGTAALNTGGNALVYSVSCATPGNCAVGGVYMTVAGSAAGQFSPFVAEETSGNWGAAIRLPGITALNSNGYGYVGSQSASCPTAGNCAVSGTYPDSNGHSQAFVANESNGVWGNAIQVPGLAGLNAGGSSVSAISCPAVGNCSTGGEYSDASGKAHAFVVDETDGTWGNAIDVPGAGALSSSTSVASVSCAIAGNCTAVGGYSDASGHSQVFVVSSSTFENTAPTTIAPAPASGAYGGTTTLSATLTSGGNGVPGESVHFSLNGSSAGSATTDTNGVATLPNVSLAGIAAGSYPTGVAVSFSGDTTYHPANGTGSLTIAKLSQAIAVTTHAPANASYGDQFTVAATGGGSGNAVTYGSSGACTNSGATYTVTGTGQCTVIYNQAGNTNYDAAPQVTESVTATRPAPAGLIGLNGVSVVGGTVASQYVMSNGGLSLSGVVVTGNVTSTQGSVSVAKNARVNGNVASGTTASILGVVSGSVTPNAPSPPLTAQNVSTCSPFSANAGVSGGMFTYSASTGNLAIKSGTVKIANGTYCFNDITLADGATLSVNGPVTIHLTGTLTGAKGHIVNHTNLVANLHIDTSYAGASGVVILGGGHAYMTVVAPRAGVSIPGGSFFGTVLAGTVSLTGGTAFHADTQ